jgi:hypothetical protein
MNRPVTINHELYFSKSSSIWEHGGVAFIRAEKNENIKTLGRMYLITTEQFEQVVRQENAIEPEDERIQIDLEDTISKGESIIDGNWYSQILFLGYEDGNPILTFTGGWSDDEIEPNPPGEKYLKTIIKGIKEAYELDDANMVEYLIDVEGIKGRIGEEILIKWVSEVEK